MSGRVDKGKAKAIAAAVADQDVKWRERYYDLKKQTQDIEADNDKLHLEILKTRRNIQRVRMERAILLERLSTMPDLPAEPLAQMNRRRSSGNSMEEDPAPTAAAFQALVREGVAAGLHRQPQVANGGPAPASRTNDGPVPINDGPQSGTIQPYQTLSPPELPETLELPATQFQREPQEHLFQQPLPLPQPHIVSNPSAPRPSGPQVPFGPPAPTRTP